MAQMNVDSSLPSSALPSSGQLIKATAAAFAVALVLLVVAVLPVEYGIDPIGAGRALGLLRNSGEVAEETPVAVQQGDAALEPVAQADFAAYGAPYRVDAAEFVLEPYDYLEYKYHLAQGAGMVFSWTADAPLTHDFHGEPDGDSNNVRSYDKSRKSAANGSFTAPMTGIHGWFWENPGNKPVTIKLTTSGFYGYAMEFKSDKTRRRHEVAVAAPPVSAQQAPPQP